VLSRVSYVRRWTTSSTRPTTARSLETLFLLRSSLTCCTPIYHVTYAWRIRLCVFALCHLGTGVLLHSLDRHFSQ
jgi:hypothetical protein